MDDGVKKKKCDIALQCVLAAAIAIAIGTALLAAPFSSSLGQKSSFITAFFTCVSSLCCAGQVVVETSLYWSLIGRTVILFLIQTGAVIYILFFCIALIRFGKKITYINRMLEQTIFAIESRDGVKFLFLRILLFVMSVELTGAVLLAGIFVPMYGWGQGLFTCVYFAVSAFCGAGAGVTASGGISFLASNLLFNFAVCLMSAVGSLGFACMIDMFTKKRYFLYETNTKYALIAFAAPAFFGIAMLLVFGAAFPAPVYADMSVLGRVLSSFLLSLSSSGAGYATVAPAALSMPSKIIVMILMLAGGLPTSTGSGVKTIAFIVAAASFLSFIRRKKETFIGNKYIDHATVTRAWRYIIILSVILCMSVCVYAVFGSGDVFSRLFDAVAACTCCAFTLGATAALPAAGKLAVCFIMLAGRFGIVGLVYGFGKKGMLKRPAPQCCTDSNLLL
jgi:trk system potassium uptake protein TrkH